MAGGYDETTLRKLGERMSAQRLLRMLTLLQSAAADLVRSANRRTDAELCLIRLSDEGLDESFAGLSARIARLEERLAQGIPAASVSAPRVESEPIVPVKAEKPVPQEDAPPWEEARPPLPEEPPEEPGGMFDASEAKPAQPKPAPAPTPAPAVQGGDSTFWPSFAAGLRGKVSPTVMPYLNNPAKVTGTWKNGQLTLWVDSELTRTMLNKPSVLEKLAQAAAGVFGGQPQVSIVTGTPPPAEPGQPAPAPSAERDPLDDLAASFGGLDNITFQ